LQEQLSKAQAERDAVLAQNIELQGIISFAQETQELVDFKRRYNFSQALLAQVLVKNFSEQSHFFLIDKGSSSGAQKDMVVIYKDCLIGRISEVYPHYSKVVLISDQSCKVAAYCAQSKATGIYQGSNEEWAASLNHVSHLSSLEIGELILSSGDGLIFPRGFGLGKIKEYHTQGLFQQVAIEPLVDLHAINHCYVVQKSS
jgi:rod shape-determining protein MreC